MLFGFVPLDRELHTGRVLRGFLFSVCRLVANTAYSSELTGVLLDIQCVCFVFTVTCVEVQFL